jgi:hypothetical protein
MMQAAQSRDRNDSAIGRWILFGLASGGGFFAKAEVGAVFMVVIDVFVHEVCGFPSRAATKPSTHEIGNAPRIQS